MPGSRKFLKIRCQLEIEFGGISVMVESGSDDPDYLGHLDHFIWWLSGSHSQNKLSGCDPDF